MKCPKCQHNQKRNLGYTCAQCGRTFVFQTRGVADGFFMAIIRKVSGNDTYYFTKNQLYAQFCVSSDNASPRMAAVMSGLAFLLCVIATIGVFLGWRWAPWLGVGGAAWLTLVFGLRYNAPKRSFFDSLLGQWTRAENVPKLLRARALETPPPGAAEPDILDYGAESILIVDSDEMVDFLVLNGVHADLHTLVISKTGYPHYVTPLVQQVLAKQPDITVFLLHGSDRVESVMERFVPGIDCSRHNVIDLGWNRAEAVRIPRLKSLALPAWKAPIPVDFLHPKALIGALTVALNTRVRFAAPVGGLQSDDKEAQLVLAGTHFG